MKKRLIAMILALMMLVSMVPVCVQAAGNEITVYFSMSVCGELAKSKDGAVMACAELKLQGKESYTLDDVFVAAHEKYYTDGVAGYATSVSEKWGLSVDKLWGDTSYNFGYQVNSGQESVMGPDHVIENGDYIDACIYQNPSIEAYSFFDMHQA